MSDSNLTGQAALAAKLAAAIHEFCEDLPWKDSERIGAEAAKAAWETGAGSDTERPRRCSALVPEGNVITEGRQCQQYEGHPHLHTWYGDNGTAYSAWRTQ